MDKMVIPLFSFYYWAAPALFALQVHTWAFLCLFFSFLYNLVFQNKMEKSFRWFCWLTPYFASGKTLGLVKRSIMHCIKKSKSCKLLFAAAWFLTLACIIEQVVFRLGPISTCGKNLNNKNKPMVLMLIVVFVICYSCKIIVGQFVVRELYFPFPSRKTTPLR